MPLAKTPRLSPLTRLTVVLAAIGLVVALRAPARAQETVTVAAGDTWFCDVSFQGRVCDTTITAGDTVAWDFTGTLPHTTTGCGTSCDSPTNLPLWDSGVMSGGVFQFTFTQPGTYLYYCRVHPAQQRGRIVVQAPEPTQTPRSIPPPVDDGLSTPAPTATPAGVTGVPKTGQGPDDGPSSAWWIVGLLAAAGVALAGSGVVALRRNR